jgi:tRNA G18 (ribose-2'-O)-methylase SpoU
VFVCAPGYFERSTGHDFHRGCLCLARRPAPLDWRDLVLSARRIVVLEGVANADNVGGVFRNAAAFGVDAVLLGPGTSDPLYRKAVRTSMGASLSVPFARLGSAPDALWPDCLEHVRACGFELIALTPREPSLELEEFAARVGADHRLVLIVGSEGPGLSSAALRFADVRVRIDISPRVDSLNLAVATGIALSRLGPRRAV